MIKLTSKDGGVTFAVRVQPRASQRGIVGELDGALKVRLAAPPVEGAANEELIKLLAKCFTVARNQVTIISGASSKAKIVRIAGIAVQEAERKLADASNK